MIRPDRAVLKGLRRGDLGEAVMDPLGIDRGDTVCSADGGLCRKASMVLDVSERIRITTNVAQVLAVLLDDPQVERYGLELMRATGQPSGTLYPILTRLQEAGWIQAGWEDIDPSVEGRPARRYYRLTAEGLPAARTELAALHARLQPRSAGGPLAAGPAPLATNVGW
jgi:DNA-binding PadR family transcriptional regulator